MGTNRTLTIVARIAAGTPTGTMINNTATVSASTIDPNPANNSASATVTVV